MISPHDDAFRYRPHLLALVVGAAIAAALLAPGSDRTDKMTDALAIIAASALGYGIMRAFVWVAVRSLANAWPRLVRYWGLIWFYGAIPLSLLGLYLGSKQLGASAPNTPTVAFVVVGAASMAAGAFAAIRTDAGRPTGGWSGRE